MHMGGVDLMDSFLGRYRIRVKYRSRVEMVPTVVLSPTGPHDNKLMGSSENQSDC